MATSNGTSGQQVGRVVSDFMTQRLRSKGFEWSSSSSDQHRSSSCASVSDSLSQTLQQQAEDMMTDYGLQIRSMVDQAVTHTGVTGNGNGCNAVVDSSTSPSSRPSLDPPLDNYNSFRLMADSMISDGIQWSHILTLMVFVSELAYEQGVRQGHGATFIASCSEWLVRYFSSDVIQHFIRSNGGWDGMVTWAADKSSSSSNNGNSAHSPSHSPTSPSLTNGLLLGIGSAVTAAVAFLSLR